MNRALQSYTPKAREFNYDALQNNLGCQPISGTRFFNALPFTRICIVEHNDDVTSPFNKPLTVSYSYGPSELNGGFPFTTLWAAWSTQDGARYGKFSEIDDSSGAGVVSPLQTGDISGKQISLAFDANGRMAIAIQKTATTIEIKWFTDDTGTIQTVTFTGVSPQLFYNGLLYGTDVENATEIICYYLNPNDRTAIFARFQKEGFSTTRTINSIIPVALQYLISISETIDRKVEIIALDEEGRDVTLTTNEYITEISLHKATLSTHLNSGRVDLVGVFTPTIPAEKATLTLDLDGGRVYKPIIEPSPALTLEKATLTISLDSGVYL